MTDLPGAPAADLADAQILENSTGIEADDMYRMSLEFCLQHGTHQLCLNGHRLMHALLHRTCRSLPEWSECVMQPDEGYRLPCKTVRAQLGLEKTKGNRELHEGVEALASAGIFEFLCFLHGNEWISWRFDDDVLALLLEQHVYGLFDASALSLLKKPIDFQVFNHVSVRRRMRKARFTLSVADVAFWIGQDLPSWSKISAPFIEALRKSCEIYGLTACVMLSCWGYTRGIDTVEIRLRHKGGFWSPGTLAKGDPFVARCIVIDSSGHRTVRPVNLEAFLNKLKSVSWDLRQLK